MELNEFKFDTSKYVVLHPATRNRITRGVLDCVRNLINTLDTEGMSGKEVRKLIYHALDKLEPKECGY